MKLRPYENVVTEVEEEREVRKVKDLFAEVSGRRSTSLPETYWANLIVRTNERIDKAASGKAISISWAMRVALPGVVAILSFFIGLHYYYVPNASTGETSLTSIVTSMPQSAFDSLLTDPVGLDASLGGSNVNEEIFVPSQEQISEYLVSTGNVSSVLDLMSKEQVQDVLTSLGSVESNTR